MKALLPGKPNLDARRSEDGSTALHIVAERGDVELLSVLLSAGANPLLTDKTGRIPIQRARSAIVIALFKQHAGVSVDIQQTETTSNAPTELPKSIQTEILAQKVDINTPLLQQSPAYQQSPLLQETQGSTTHRIIMGVTAFLFLAAAILWIVFGSQASYCVEEFSVSGGIGCANTVADLFWAALIISILMSISCCVCACATCGAGLVKA